MLSVAYFCPIEPPWYSNETPWQPDEHLCVQVVLHIICINDIINEFFVKKYQPYYIVVVFFSAKNLIDFVSCLSQMIKTKNSYQSDSHQLFYVNLMDNFLLSMKSVTKTKFEIIHFYNGVILWHGCYYEIQVQIIY